MNRKPFIPALISLSIMLALSFIGCEGPEGSEGPVGPEGIQGMQGETGPEGPSGSVITPISGVIGIGDYQGEHVRVDNDLIDEFNVHQVYLSPDPRDHTWLFWAFFAVTTGCVLIYDPDHDFIGWNYLILIIQHRE
ncbi:hypothetical protein ES703_28189 [subsurface metagenome]